MEATDPYSTAKANLRDTVKWLSTTVAGVTALVLAGTPFSGFGSLQSGPRLYWAATALALALVLLLRVWSSLFLLLRPDQVFPSQLRKQWSPGKERTEEKEIEALRRHIEAHKADLLPTGLADFDALEQHVATLWAQAAASDAAPALLEQYKTYEANVALVINYAAFRRLHERIRRALLGLATTTVGALAFLLVFVVAANPPKENAGPAVVVVTPYTSPRDSVSPVLTPVSFAFGKSDLDGAARAAITGVRDFLRAHGGAGVVLLAHTDTAGGERVNDVLAEDRGRRVRRALISEGGIQPSRVFIAALPKTDLPTITTSQTADASNRTVEFLVVSLPPRH
jgi:outer membrane protein OmpA-like peptidoglycan-associated protein